MNNWSGRKWKFSYSSTAVQRRCYDTKWWENSKIQRFRKFRNNFVLLILLGKIHAQLFITILLFIWTESFTIISDAKCYKSVAWCFIFLKAKLYSTNYFKLCSVWHIMNKWLSEFDFILTCNNQDRNYSSKSNTSILETDECLTIAFGGSILTKQEVWTGRYFEGGRPQVLPKFREFIQQA